MNDSHVKLQLSCKLESESDLEPVAAVDYPVMWMDWRQKTLAGSDSRRLVGGASGFAGPSLAALV